MSLLLHCDVIKTPSVQTWFVYFFVSVQPLSTNFARDCFVAIPRAVFQQLCIEHLFFLFDHDVEQTGAQHHGLILDTC